MENLPCDVLSNIFIRLLAKQLAQMRSVSKLWNALLSQPSFIKSHLHRSIHNNDEVLLFFHQTFDCFSEPLSAHPSKSPNLKLTNFIKSPASTISVIGSVNGLICFDNRSEDNEDCGLQIWNPSLSAVLALPQYIYPNPYYPLMMIGNLNFRFGYDPKADDYKVVKLPSIRGPPGIPTRLPPDFKLPTEASLLDPNLFVVKKWLQVEVFSMRKGYWKLITQRPPSHITWISRQYEVRIDGHEGLIHWLGFTGEEKKGQTVLGFDLGAETFHEIPLPDSILHSNRTNVLGVLARKLCVMSYVNYGECEVWVMDKYGVVESWVKHQAFSHFRNIVPFGFTLRNEFIFQVEKIDGDADADDDDRFGLYDPVAAKTKFFKVSEGITKIVEYADSLVWVAPDEVKYLGLFPLLSIAGIGIVLAIAFTVARRWRK